MNIPLSKPDIGEREIQTVTEVLRSERLSLGPKQSEFEAAFAEYAGTRYAICTNSGTSALHLCVRALGIGHQDEVITSAFSFVASTNCCLYEGAIPVLVDIDPFTLNLDPRQVRNFLKQSCVVDSGTGCVINKQTGRTVKAILPVHVFGLACEMDAILELAHHYHLAVLEDACEALGAEYHGRRVGTFGDAAVFAFYPNKQITSGEGGMIVTNNAEIAALCRSMRNQGRTEDSSWLHHVRLGYNYRLSELHCALGLAQLQRLSELLAARDRVASEYERALAGVPQLVLPRRESGGLVRSWFVYVVQLDYPSPRTIRDRVIAKLRENGIQSQAYFPALHRQPHIAAEAEIPSGSLPRTETASDRCIALPFFPTETHAEVHYVSQTLARILKEEIGASQVTGQHFQAAAGAIL